MITRYIEEEIRKDLEEKMVFLSGPRQVGKTTLAKSFLKVDFLMTFEKKPWFAVECKVKAGAPSPSLRYFGERLGIPHLYQIHMEGKDDVLDGRVRVMPAAKFLAALP